jgi:membrane-associated protease RseP (regulator of RpoE activity)
MLWSGEEQGLLGSRAYVRAHPELMPKISAVLVHDGGTNYLSGIAATPAMKSDIEAAFAPVIGLDPAMPFTIREVNGLRGGGSDHASFLAAGVPGFFWGQSGKAVYNRTHHTQHDTYDAAIPEYQRHSALVAALGAFGLANLDHLLLREGLTPPRTGPGAGTNRRIVGVQLDELTIVEVLDDSVAAQAGLKSGDVIVKLDGKPLDSRDAFVEALQAGKPVKKIVVRRDGQEIEKSLTFPSRP